MKIKEVLSQRYINYDNDLEDENGVLGVARRSF